MKIFGIYDSKAESATRFYFAENAGIAIRHFIRLVQEPGSELNRFPADFTLFQVGDADVRTMVVADEVNANLGNALSYVNSNTGEVSDGENIGE